MTSKILTITGLLCLSTLLFFCKKTDSPAAQNESPFFDFFNESSISIDTVEQAADTWEYGFTFTPLKSGRITKFGIKLPAEGDFTVTLWDLSGSAPVVLRTQTVHSSEISISSFDDIPAVAVTKGTKLGITVLSNAFYRITKAGSTSFTFPKTIGNIRIESFNESINNTGSPAFATTTNDTRVAPCVNVIFIAD